MRHNPTEACAAWHCYIHQEDEPGNGKVCLECGHLYPTRLHVWWGYLRRFYPIVWEDYPRRTQPPGGEVLLPLRLDDLLPVFAADWKPQTWRGWVWDLIRVPFRLPSRIYACPECSHDF